MPARSESAFSDFVRAHSRQLLRSAWLLTGEHASAEDLLQTALFTTWRHWPDLRDPGAAEHYTRRVLVNTYLHARRRKWTGEVPGDIPDRPGPDDAFANADRQRIVLRALDTLSPKQRAVVTLRYFLDLGEQQTASLMGCSVGAVKSHSSRALAKLQQDPSIEALCVEETDHE